MQPRQASKWPAISGVTGVPSTCCSIRWMRPRGESISSPHSTYVGHVGQAEPAVHAVVDQLAGPWRSSDPSHEPAGGQSCARDRTVPSPAASAAAPDRPPPSIHGLSYGAASTVSRPPTVVQPRRAARPPRRAPSSAPWSAPQAAEPDPARHGGAAQREPAAVHRVAAPGSARPAEAAPRPGRRRPGSAPTVGGGSSVTSSTVPPIRLRSARARSCAATPRPARPSSWAPARAGQSSSDGARLAAARRPASRRSSPAWTASRSRDPRRSHHGDDPAAVARAAGAAGTWPRRSRRACRRSR